MVVAPDRSAPVDASAVLMIVRPLVDWLPMAVSDEEAADPTDKLVEWAEAVLAWAVLAPVRMVITRTDPEDLSDLRAAAAGRWAIELGDRDLSPGAEAFRAAMQHWLGQRQGWSADLDRSRSKAAIETVAMATDLQVAADGDALRRASIEVRGRLVSAGVRVQGPPTGLIWPQPPGPDLPLDTAAEASLAMLLAALDDQSGRTDDLVDLRVAAEGWISQREAAKRELSSRRADPRNLKKAPVRSLLKLMVLGRHRG